MTADVSQIGDVDSFLRQSEYLKAYDAAVTALEHNRQDRNLQHRAVLSLARMGALERAQMRFVEFGLDRVADDEDILALDARLQKDAAFKLPEGTRIMMKAR